MATRPTIHSTLIRFAGRLSTTASRNQRTAPSTTAGLKLRTQQQQVEHLSEVWSTIDALERLGEDGRLRRLDDMVRQRARRRPTASDYHQSGRRGQLSGEPPHRSRTQSKPSDGGDPVRRAGTSTRTVTGMATFSLSRWVHARAWNCRREPRTCGGPRQERPSKQYGGLNRGTLTHRPSRSFQTRHSPKTPLFWTTYCRHCSRPASPPSRWIQAAKHSCRESGSR